MKSISAGMNVDGSSIRQTIAGFDVEAELGRGAYSTVYRVWAPGHDGSCALRILDVAARNQANVVAF